MQRYVFLALLVFFLFAGIPLSPLTGWTAEPTVKKTAASPSTTVKKVSTSKPTGGKKAAASTPATDSAAQAKATAAKKERPPEKKAAPAKKQVAVKENAAVAAGTSARQKKPAQKTTGKPTVAKPAQMSAQRSSAEPPAKQVTRKKKRGGRAPLAASAAVAATGTLPDITEQISSKSVMVMDAATGEAIFAKAPDAPRQPASTIKIVTGMIALKSLEDDDFVRVSPKAAGMPSSKVNLDPGQSYKVDDLINAVLLASANDASVALAEGISGSEEQFANLMTMSARMWGASNTVCRTASGLTAEGQQSTARDLANLFRYAMRHEDFARRMHERSISTSYGKSLRNHNKALWRIDGADGGKTGYTTAARQTYVGQFSRDGHTIVVAIMGSESLWADLAKLVNYGFEKKRRDELARGASEISGARDGNVSIN